MDSTDITDAQIKALAEMIGQYDKMAPEAKQQLETSDNLDIGEFEKWKVMILKASGGDATSIADVKAQLAEINNVPTLLGASTCNKNSYDFYWHTKNKWPRWTVQRLWISHDILQRATDLADLAKLVADATEDKRAIAVVIGIMIGLAVLKSKDKGCGIYLRWEPGPLVPGAGGVISEFKSQ